MIRLIILIAGLAFITVPKSLNGQESGSISNKTSQLETAIPKLMESFSIPGLSVAVSKNGQLLYHQGFGYSDVKDETKANSETLFRMASVSKLFAAAAIAKLMDEGKLDIDAPIENYIKDYPMAGKGVTTKLLLSHQAGIRHYGRGDMIINAKNYKSTDDALKIFINDPLEFEPGTSYKYSTFAFTLIQAIVEAASGMDYLSYLKNEIFEPLDMQRSFPDIKKMEYENHSLLYRVKKRGEITQSIYDNPSYKWGGGGMLSSATDLVKFGEAHMRDGFYKQETLDSIFTPAAEMPGVLTPTEVGLAWRIGKDPKGNTIYHHAGNMNGARSILMLSPSDGTVVSVMSNNRQLDFIENFAVAIRDHIISPDEIVFASEYELLDTLDNEVKGRIKLKKQTPLFSASIEIDELFVLPLEVDLISNHSDKGSMLRNLKVYPELLYLELKTGSIKPGSLELYHKNDDDSWSKKEYLLKQIKS